MAITSAAAASISSLYIGFYGRAPDPVGLSYWMGRLADGVSLQDIGESFAASPEAALTYPYIAKPTEFTPDEMVNQVYLNVLNRPADKDGLDYYVARLEAGESVGSVLVSIIGNAAANEDGAFPDSGILANKIAIGLNWAEQGALALNKVYEADGATLTADASASAHGVIEGVNETDASVVEGNAEVDTYFGDSDSGGGGSGGGSGGGVVTLTTATDVERANIFNGPLATDQGLPGENTLNSSDVLMGIGRNATLNVVLNSTPGTPVAPTLKGIATINLQSGDGGAWLDLGKATGVQTINNENSVSEGQVDNITMVKGMTLGVSNYSAAGPGNQNQAFAFTEASLASADDAVTVNVRDVVMDQLSVSGDGASNGIETVNLASTGSATNVLDLAVEGMQTLNITGTADLDLTGTDGDQVLGDGNLTAIDAAAFEGSLTATLSDGLEDADVTFTGGAGGDTIDAGTGLTNGDVLDGGAGANVLALRANAAGEFVDSAVDGDINVTNFQTLHLDIGDVDGNNGVNSSIDFAAFSNADTFENVEVHAQDSSGGTGFNIDLVNAAAGAEFMLLNSEITNAFGGITLNYVDGAEPDEASIALINNSIGSNLYINSLSVGGNTGVGDNLQILNISTTHAAALGATDLVRIDTLTTDSVEIVNITGDTDLYIWNTVDEGIKKIDASNFTGNLRVQISHAEGAEGGTIQGGSGDDTLWGTAANDTIDGGDGNDLIYGLSGADTLSGGAGDDIVQGWVGIDSIDLGAGKDDLVLVNVLSSADRDVVTNFNAGDNGDVIWVWSNDTSAGNAEVVVQDVNATGAPVAFDTSANDIIEFAVDLLDTNMLDSTTLLQDLTGTANGLTVTASSDTGYLVAYAAGNAYLYHLNSGGDNVVDAAEVQVVGIFNDIAVGSFNASNFLLI